MDLKCLLYKQSMLPRGLTAKYTYGYSKDGDTNIVVTSGAGFWGPPCRVASGSVSDCPIISEILSRTAILFPNGRRSFLPAIIKEFATVTASS